MKHLVCEVGINDDTWWDLGADEQTFCMTAVGHDLYHQTIARGCEFELEFLDRDWNNQFQKIRLWLYAEPKTLTWFWLHYSPIDLD